MRNDTISEADLYNILQTQFGFTSFRPGQLAALTALMAQGRLLCIQPTGHGKSLLYQLPAALLPGIVLVISPLIALMRDQIGQLQKRFNIPAASINSDQTDEENSASRLAAINLHVKILFVAPEQLDHVDRFNYLLNLPISLLVVDEAHCISTWGHDFRPSYRQIIHLVNALQLKNATLKLLALTATANTKAEQDIKQQLTVGNKPIVVHRESMDRPNIKLDIYSVNGLADKLATVEKIMNTLTGVGLIYCATQDHCEIVAEYLKQQNINAASYHAGYSPEEKRKLQQGFLNNQFKVIAATNALGMGIDKSDLRYVIHFDIPGSITAYYQEVGRCGRDGLPALGILLYDPSDKAIQEYFINSAQPTQEHFQDILSLLVSADSPLKITEIKQRSGLHPTLVNVVIAELTEQGFISKSSMRGSQVYSRTALSGFPDLERYKNQYILRTQELAAMLHYANKTNICLMRHLRDALGDQETKSCGRCCRCCNEQNSLQHEDIENRNINHWLLSKGMSIKPHHIWKTDAGIAILDGKIRTPEFIYFMKQRTQKSAKDLGLSTTLVNLLEKHVNELVKQRRIGSVVVIPSHTWSSRDEVARMIATQLKVPVFLDYLSWQKTPMARQGALLNNDQRRDNVHECMQCNYSLVLPNDAVLLLDDYTGSGATLNEAFRVLRKQGNITNAILPLTLAVVKWRLGKAGMI